MPLSSSSKTKTDPEVIIFRSESTRRRVTRGIRPRRAASRMRRASPVVSIQPDQGGSVHVVDEPWPLPWESGGDDMEASYYITRRWCMIKVLQGCMRRRVDASK